MPGSAPGSRLGRAAKRLFDLAFVIVALPFCVPLALAVAVAIRLESRGPVIYGAARVGQNGRQFRLFKFRSMFQDASGPGLTYANDPRVTKVGRLLRRTKFDEFPQVFNVLRGQMSIVGPRPEAPEYVARYSPEQRQALTMRPGLTSLAQVAHRDEEDELPAQDTEAYYVAVIMPQKLRIDVAYVDGWSIWLDLRIFAVGLAALFRADSLLGLDRIVESALSDDQAPGG
ncbi:MAG: sugar transferase [Chloroflexi bacterium]|nr:sugar transferase [Chloroflexota bacterium]